MDDENSPLDVKYVEDLFERKGYEDDTSVGLTREECLQLMRQGAQHAMLGTPQGIEAFLNG